MISYIMVIQQKKPSDQISLAQRKQSKCARLKPITYKPLTNDVPATTTFS